MKKLLLTICILVGIHAVSQAQLSVSPHISPTFPIGPVNNYVNTGMGYGAELMYSIDGKWKIGAGIDRYHFNLDIDPLGLDLGGILDDILGNIDFDFNVVPITGIVQYMLPASGVHPYVGIEAGAYNITAKGFGFDITRTYFGLAPTVGLIYPVSDVLDVYASAKLQTVFVQESVPILENRLNEHLMMIPINLGVSFKLNQ